MKLRLIAGDCTHCGGHITPEHQPQGYGERIRCQCDDHFIVTPAGRDFLNDPPRGACAAWVKNPSRWQPREGHQPPRRTA